MSTGPVQLLAIAFADDSLSDEIRAEFDRLSGAPGIRLLDALFVQKDEQGDLHVAQLEDDTPEVAPGRYLMALFDGGAADLSHLEGVDATELWDAAAAIPSGTVAAILLIEHEWAAPLREALERAGGAAVVDAWVAREDLASIGLHPAAS
jgi:hypothetical protein